MMYSFDVKFEGKNVCRLGDPLFHNKKILWGKWMLPLTVLLKFFIFIMELV